MSQNTKISPAQAADYFDGKPLPDAPSGLPTLNEVQNFMERWRARFAEVSPADHVTFHVSCSPNGGTRCHGFINAHSFDAVSPETLLKQMEGVHGPDAKAARVAQLKAELATLEAA